MVTGRAAGVASGLAAAALFGASTPVARLLLPGSGVFMLAGLLYLGAGLGLAALAPVLRPGREAALQESDIPALSAMVLAGGIVGPLLLLMGLARLPAGQTSLLLNLEAPFTIALAVFVLGESLAGSELLGAVAVIAGAAAMTVEPGMGGGHLVGALAVGGASLAWAIDNNLSRQLSLRDPVAVARAKTLVAGAVNVGAALAAGESLPAARPLAAALATGFVGYGVSILLHLVALRHVGAARQAAYFSTAPFIGAVAAVPFLGEHLTSREFLAGAFMAFGVVLLVRARHGHAHVHEPLIHDHAHVHDAHHRHGHDANALPEPHAHPHVHEPLNHDHPHQPDLHHRHRHR